MFRIVTAAMLLSLAGAAHAGTSVNGPYINGLMPNGMLNGMHLNGMLNGASLNGMLNGFGINGAGASGDTTLDSVILIGVELPR
jgi:hypothetical protein